MNKRANEPVITVRLVGVKPESVPLTTMTDLMGAIQSLGGPNLRLLNVRRTSAAYELYSDKDVGRRVVSNMKRCAEALATPETFLRSEMLPKFDLITAILKRLDCYMEIFSPDRSWKWQLKKNQWDGIRDRFCIEDDAVVIGELKKIGGASKNRCTVRVPFQKELVYCDIENPGIARRLGGYLYGDVELRGRGRFFTKDWKLISFRVSDFHVRKQKSWDQCYEDGRKAGAKAWDDIADPIAFLEEMR